MSWSPNISSISNAEIVAEIEKTGEVSISHGDVTGKTFYRGVEVSIGAILDEASRKGVTVYQKCFTNDNSLVGESFQVYKTVLTTTKFESALDFLMKEAFSKK